MKRRTLKRDPKQVKKSFKRTFKSGNRKKPDKKEKDNETHRLLLRRKERLTLGMSPADP